jgi:hypothetical protein
MAELLETGYRVASTLPVPLAPAAPCIACCMALIVSVCFRISLADADTPVR